MARPMLDSKIPGYVTGKNIPKFLRKTEFLCRTPGLVQERTDGISRSSRFSVQLALHLPDAAARIDEEDFGILHLETGALKLATRDAIARRDWQTVARHFDFAAEMLGASGAELRDALCVSYLGNLLYEETSLNYAKARSLLPKSLAMALEEIERHYSHAAHRAAKPAHLGLPR